MQRCDLSPSFAVSIAERDVSPVPCDAPRLRLEASAREEVHRQGGRERRHLDEVSCFLANLAPELHALARMTDRVDQAAHDRPAYTGPIGDLLHQLRAMLAHD